MNYQERRVEECLLFEAAHLARYLLFAGSAGILRPILQLRRSSGHDARDCSGMRPFRIHLPKRFVRLSGPLIAAECLKYFPIREAGETDHNQQKLCYNHNMWTDCFDCIPNYELVENRLPIVL